MSEFTNSANRIATVSNCLIIDISFDCSVSARGADNELVGGELGVLNDPSLSFNQLDLLGLLVFIGIGVKLSTLLGGNDEASLKFVLRVLEAETFRVDELSSLELIGFVNIFVD